MSGSLREKSPGVWEIRVALGRDPLTGSYRTVSRTIHGGKRKAQEEIARIVSSAANGKFQRFHDLRHLAATVLASSGVDIRTIGGRLGHAHAAITLRTYAHFMEAADRDAAAVMGRLALASLAGVGGPPEPTVELSA